MALNLSKDEREELERDLGMAVPYSKEDPAIRTLDGKIDVDRIRATMAKKFLEESKEKSD